MPRASQRCFWAGDDPLMIAYHDDEWGRPDRRPEYLFELLTLESFQSGLSWSTILNKREAFQQAFDGFDAARVAGYDDKDVARLLAGDRGEIVGRRSRARRHHLRANRLVNRPDGEQQRGFVAERRQHAATLAARGGRGKRHRASFDYFFAGAAGAAGAAGLSAGLAAVLEGMKSPFAVWWTRMMQSVFPLHWSL